jgi:hypothetical protein
MPSADRSSGRSLDRMRIEKCSSIMFRN